MLMDTLDYSKLSLFFKGGMKSDCLCMELNDDHLLVGSFAVCPTPRLQRP